MTQYNRPKYSCPSIDRAIEILEDAADTIKDTLRDALNEAFDKLEETRDINAQLREDFENMEEALLNLKKENERLESSLQEFSFTETEEHAIGTHGF